MSEKDVKTKPKTPPKTVSAKNTPKVAVKSKEAVTNTIKDAKRSNQFIIKKAKDERIKKAYIYPYINICFTYLNYLILL